MSSATAAGVVPAVGLGVCSAVGVGDGVPVGDGAGVGVGSGVAVAAGAEVEVLVAVGAGVCVGMGVSAGAWVAAGGAPVAGSGVADGEAGAVGVLGTVVPTAGATCSPPQAARAITADRQSSKTVEASPVPVSLPGVDPKRFHGAILRTRHGGVNDPGCGGSSLQDAGLVCPGSRSRRGYGESRPWTRPSYSARTSLSFATQPSRIPEIRTLYLCVLLLYLLKG